MRITQEDIPDIIPPQQGNLGKQQSLVLLVTLVEPEIPD